MQSAEPRTTFCLEPATASSGRILQLLTSSVAFYLFGAPLATLVATIPVDEAVKGAALRLHAVCFGLPLLLACSFALRRWLGRKIYQPEVLLLDLFVLLMTTYWLVQSVRGTMLGNPTGYVLSTSFNFLVPSLAYGALRGLEPEAFELLVHRVMWLALWSEPINFLSTVHALLGFDFVGAGGVGYLLPFTCGLIYLGSGRYGRGYGLLVLSTLSILFAMKRVVWLGTPVLVLLYVALSRRMAIILAVVGLVLSAFLMGDLLPEQVGFAALTARLQALENETAGFAHGQAREDEVNSIWTALVTDGGEATILFGLGMGATYTYYADSTQNGVLEGHHDTHFTPMGWMLRGGVIGTLLNALFYLILVGVTLGRILGLRQEARRVWAAGFASYFYVALLCSATSFCLTPNPLIHLVCFAVVLAAEPFPPTTPKWPRLNLARERMVS